MADTSKKVSELSTASQVNNSDLVMLSQGDSQQGFASLKATILAIAQKIATGINFTSDLQTTDKTIVGAINEAAASGNTDIIADEFDNTATYDVGDYCIYQGTLYKCISAITTAGQWDSTDWDSTIVMDEVGQGGGGSGGHTILNDSGSALSQEDNLQFKGTYVHDDSTNEKTVVEVVRSMTRAEFDLLSNAEKKGIIEVTDEDKLIFSGKSLTMKTKTYTGTGSATNAINFDEKPLAIFNIYGAGLNASKVLSMPFIYGETTYCVSSFSNSGMLFCSLAYSNNDMTMTLTGVDVGAAFNIQDQEYEIWYLVEENFNKFKEITGVLEAGDTEITFSSDCIGINSTIEPFASKAGLAYTGITINPTDYTFSSFMDGKIVVRENNNDNTDIKLFICGLTKTTSDIEITDTDLLDYLSDITSGYLKACETFDTADSTTQTGILAISNDSGSMLIRTYIVGWTQYKAGTFYGVIDLNESPVAAQGSPAYQMNEYEDPYDVSMSATVTFPVQSEDINVKVRVS